jgi:restriction system protein
LQRPGGSGRPDEVRSVIADRLNLTEEQLSEPLPSKAQPRFDNQVHWARFYLSKGGYIDSSKRGVRRGATRLAEARK